MSATSGATGEFRLVRPGRHQWETNFVPDVASFALGEWKERGAGGTNVQFVLADSTMHAHTSEFPTGTYKKAHRHPAGAHIFPVTGEGYSLLWNDGDRPTDTIRIDWKRGSLFAPPDDLYHQHFNVTAAPARYLVFGFAGGRYPTVSSWRATMEDMDKSTKHGGLQIEYEDEDPDVLRLFEDELERRGVPSRMREIVGSRG